MLIQKDDSISTTSNPNQLSYYNYPFFEGLHPLPSNLNSFFNEVLTIKVEVFIKCAVRGALIKHAYYAVRGCVEA